MNQDYSTFHKIAIFIYWYVSNLMGLAPWALGLTGLGVHELGLGWAEYSRAHSWHWSGPPSQKVVIYHIFFSTGSHSPWASCVWYGPSVWIENAPPPSPVAERRKFMPQATPQRALTCNLNIDIWRKGIILLNKILISKEISKNDGYRSQHNTHWKQPPNTLPHSKRKP